MSKLAFVFPGQGSQAIGMIEDLWNDPIALEYFERADNALGYSLSSIIKEGPIEKLNDTAVTQPALLTVSTILWEKYLAEGGEKPTLLAGHSLGEYSALVAAGVIAFDDAVRLVSERGKLMQEAVPAGVGAMAAILGLDDEVVIELCGKISTEEDYVAAANFNSPGQVVIAGNSGAVERACDAAKEAGARRALPLAVSVPSHSALMKPAAEKLAKVLSTIEFNTPTIPVLHNADVASHNDVDAIKEALIEQLYLPVRWTESILKMADEGVTDLVECGSGKVLAGLIRRIDKTLSCKNIFDGASLDALLEEQRG